MNIQATSNNLQTTSAFADLDSSLKNISFSKLQSTNPSLAFHLLCGLSVTDYQAAYRKGILTPLDVFNALILSPDWSENPALFPTGRNPQAIAFYRQLAEESSIRWKNGNILSEYDGIFIATKDLFASPNGKGEYEATLGSVATLVRSDKPSYIVDKYQKLGMISIPVGSVTGGMGGDERNVAGSRLDNRVPLNEQIMFDENGEVTVGTTLAGSSSASIYSLRQSIFALSTGTDTGGSVKAPASMVAHVAGFVPKQNQESREGLYPSHVGLDHVGFLARGAQATEEVMKFATAVHEDWKSAPSSQKPIVVCLKDDIDSLETEIQSSFLAQIENLRSQGITVVVLDDPRYSKILGEFQTDVYGPYHVVGNAVAAMNPTQTQRFEPPRYGYILDPNAADDRYLKAEAAFGFYPRFKRLVDLNNHAVRKILGMDQTKREIVLMLSQPQRIPLAQIHNWNPHEALVRPNAGKYPRLVASPIGAKLDGHDRRTMISNFTPGMHTLIPQANSALKIGRQCVLMGTNSTAIEQVNRLRQSPAPALSNRNSPQLRIARAS